MIVMPDVTDYGLTATKIAGALMILAFVRAMFLYARGRLRPAPVLGQVRAPSALRPRRAKPPAPPEISAALPATPAVPIAPNVPPPDVSAPPLPLVPPAPLTGEILPPGAVTPTPTDSDLSLSDVVLGTHGGHIEETAQGDRFVYWSLTKFRPKKPGDA